MFMFPRAVEGASKMSGLQFLACIGMGVVVGIILFVVIGKIMDKWIWK